MSREVMKDVQQGFKGGLNVVTDESQLAPNEVRVAANVRFTEDGAASRRKGTQRLLLTPLSADVRGGFAWNNSGTQTLLVMSNGTLYTGSYGIPAMFTAQVGAFDPTVLPGFAAFRNPTKPAVCYIADGGPLNKYDGTALTVNLAGTPNAAVVATYNSRLFGITGNDEYLYWSGLDDGDSLGVVASGGGVAAIRTFGKQKLVGLLALGDSLLLIHERGISKFTGVSIDDISILAGTRGMSQDVGTVAPHSIVAVENHGYLISDRGFYKISNKKPTAYNPDATAGEAVSIPIDTIVAAMPSADLQGVIAVHSRATREVWFYLPNIGVYAFNYRTGNWAGPWDGSYLSPTPHALFEAQDTLGKSVILSGAADGHIRHCDYPSLYLDDAGLSQNLVVRSQELDAAPWGNNVTAGIVAANTTVAPDGTTTADTVTRIANNFDGRLQQISFTGDGTKTVSWFIKQGTSAAVDVSLYDQTVPVAVHTVRATWTAGVPVLTTIAGAGTLFTPTLDANGFYRIAFAPAGVVAAHTNALVIYPSVIGANGDTVIAWGAQARNAVDAGTYLATGAGISTAPALGGTPYTMNLRCHRMFSGDLSAEKSLRWIYLVADLGNSTSASIQWRTATEAGAFLLTAPATPKWGSIVWGSFRWGSSGSETFRVPASGRGHWVEITIVDNGSASAVYSNVEVVSFNMGRR